MTATKKKVKDAPLSAAKKHRAAPVVAQARKVAPKRKVAQVKKVAQVQKMRQVKEVTQIEQAVPAACVTQAQEAAPIAEVASAVKHPDAGPQAGENVDRILLPARMELACLDEAQQLLQSRYPPVHDTYVLDGAQLSVIDMAGIQMLISFIRSVTARGSRVEWDNYSVQVYQLASELGVTSQLGD